MQRFIWETQNVCERVQTFYEWMQKVSWGNEKVLQVKAKLVGWTQNVCQRTKFCEPLQHFEAQLSKCSFMWEFKSFKSECKVCQGTQNMTNVLWLNAKLLRNTAFPRSQNFASKCNISRGNLRVWWEDAKFVRKTKHLQDSATFCVNTTFLRESKTFRKE